MMQEMNKIACLFPGQGSQYVGMAQTLLEHFVWTKEIFEEASDAIKVNLKALCLEGPEDKLQLTANAQPCILTTSVCWFEVLNRELGIIPDGGAGHSLGEYSALVSAKAIKLREAVGLVRKRGELMQDTVPVGKGKMAALMGLQDEKIMELCQEASEGDDSIVVPANFNAPGQVVIAGHAEAVDRAVLLASGDRSKFKARKVIPLKVSAPFHSPLMGPVAEKFVFHLRKASWQNPHFPIVSNLDAVLRKEGDWPEILKNQIDHPVLWTSCVQTLAGSNFAKFIEVGPNKVLTGLSKRIATEGHFFTVDSLDEMKTLEKMLREDL